MTVARAKTDRRSVFDRRPFTSRWSWTAGATTTVGIVIFVYAFLYDLRARVNVTTPRPRPFRLPPACSQLPTHMCSDVQDTVLHPTTRVEHMRLLSGGSEDRGEEQAKDPEKALE